MKTEKFLKKVCLQSFATDYVIICRKRLWLLPDNINLLEISLMTSEIAKSITTFWMFFGADCRRGH